MNSKRRKKILVMFFPLIFSIRSEFKYIDSYMHFPRSLFAPPRLLNMTFQGKTFLSFPNLLSSFHVYLLLYHWQGKKKCNNIAHLFWPHLSQQSLILGGTGWGHSINTINYLNEEHSNQHVVLSFLLFLDSILLHMFWV